MILPDILFEELVEALYYYHYLGDEWMENKIWEELNFLCGIISGSP
jgi:hypothetical protein